MKQSCPIYFKYHAVFPRDCARRIAKFKRDRIKAGARFALVELLWKVYVNDKGWCP